jgi:hypothetical protein
MQGVYIARRMHVRQEMLLFPAFVEADKEDGILEL